MANNRTSFSIHNILNGGLDCERNAGLDEEYAEEQEAQGRSSSSLPVRNDGAESISSCVLVLDSSPSDQHSCEEGSTGGEDNSPERQHGETLRQLHIRCIGDWAVMLNILLPQVFALHVCQTWIFL